MHNQVINLAQLNQLVSDTYVYAVIVVLVAVLISILGTSLVPWQGGKDKSYVTRRIIFVIVGIFAILGFWLYNDQVVADTIKNQGFLQMFKSCNLKCLGITSVGYLLISGILMCVFRNSKFASIIFKIKGK